MINIKYITDFESRMLDLYTRTSETELLRYYEPAPGLFLCESAKVIRIALDKGYVPVSFLVEKELIGDSTVECILRQCEEVPVYVAERRLLINMVGYNLTNGMLCVMERKAQPIISELIADVRRIAVLEDVVNPTNIGAIVRSAAALNIDAIVMSSGCSDPLYRRAIRVSMGTIFQIPWVKLHKKQRAPIELLKEHGFKSVAMALTDDSVSLDDKRLKEIEKLAIFLGTEGDGLSSDTIAACDYTVRIPMSHGVDSLNVAAASAVAFWELSK